MKLDTTRAILFDLDGTLIDSVPDLAAAVNATLERYGRDGVEEERVRRWVGNGARVLVRRALENAGIGVPFDEALQTFMEAYEARMCDRTRCYEGVPETLAALRERGYRMGVVTNKPHRFVAPILEHLKIDGFFDAVLGGDALPEKKPHPLPLLTMAGKLGARIPECAMVGDSKNDILAAKAAGMPSVAVEYGYNYGEPIEEAGPDLVVEEFRRLSEVFA